MSSVQPLEGLLAGLCPCARGRKVRASTFQPHFSASSRKCRSGRKCLSLSRFPRYSTDSLSIAATPSESSGRCPTHSDACNNWFSMSEKSCGVIAEQRLRSGRRRTSADRRYSFTCRKVSTASRGIIPSIPWPRARRPHPDPPNEPFRPRQPRCSLPTSPPGQLRSTLLALPVSP